MSQARRVGLLRCQSGASAVEYGLLVSVIAVAIVAAVSALGNALSVELYQGLAQFFAEF